MLRSEGSGNQEIYAPLGAPCRPAAGELKGRHVADQKMLPNSYKEALKGFKGQADAASAQLGGEDKKASRAALREAQLLMAAHPTATKDIYRVLMNSDTGLTIDTLDDERLAKELGVDYLAQFSDDAA